MCDCDDNASSYHITSHHIVDLVCMGSYWATSGSSDELRRSEESKKLGAYFARELKFKLCPSQVDSKTLV